MNSEELLREAMAHVERMSSEERRNYISDHIEHLADQIRMARDIANSCVEFMQSRADMVDIHPMVAMMVLAKLMDVNMKHLYDGHCGVPREAVQAMGELLDKAITEGAMTARPREYGSSD